MQTNTLTEQPVRTPTWNGGESDFVDLMLLGAVSFAISQVLLALLIVILNPRRSQQQWLYILLLLTVVGYFLAPFTVNSPWNIAVISLLTGIPGVFWLFSNSMFDDHFTLRPWQFSLVSATVLLPLVVLLARQMGREPSDFWVTILVDIPALLELLLVGLAVLAIARYWRVDLVQARRNLRLWLCSVNGIYLLILLIMRELLYPYFPWLNYAQYILGAIVLLITNAMLLRPDAGFLTTDTRDHKFPILPPPKSNDQTIKYSREAQTIEQPVAPAADTTAKGNRDTNDSKSEETEKTEVPADVLDQLHALMDEERIYRDMELTMGQLAYRLNLQEYRLRKVINNGLGYRNFNDFLNSYRIAEASERLRNPEEAKIPITTIALDAGFRSISTFNKAFKNHFNETPTAFRRRNLTDAAES